MNDGNNPREVLVPVSILLVGSVVAVLFLLLLVMYVAKSRELEETAQFSRFQSFLLDCECRASGTTDGWPGDQAEETEYRCEKNGGTIHYSAFIVDIDGSYDQKKRNQTFLCPDVSSP